MSKHYLEYFENDYVKAHELKGKDVTVTIMDIDLESLIMEGGIKNDKMVMSFKESPKKFVCNKTNGKLIAKVLKSTDSLTWTGKKITLYPTTTKCKGEVVDCIRVRANAKGGI